MKVLLNFIVPIFLAFSLILASTGSNQKFSVRPAMVMLQEARFDTAETIGELNTLIESLGRLNQNQFSGLNISKYVGEDDGVFEMILNYIKGFFVMCWEFFTNMVPYLFELFNVAMDILFNIAQLLFNEIKMVIVLLNVLFSFSSPLGAYSQ